ncbi:MAG: hypothetical protein Q9215_003161 [Flavoplaca cf. flavocitrina]
MDEHIRPHAGSDNKPLDSTQTCATPMSHVMDERYNWLHEWMRLRLQPTARDQLRPKVWGSGIVRGNERINLLIPQPIAPSFIALSKRGIVPYHREPSAACLDHNFRDDKPSEASSPSPSYLIRQQPI